MCTKGLLDSEFLPEGEHQQQLLFAQLPLLTSEGTGSRLDSLISYKQSLTSAIFAASPITLG